MILVTGATGKMGGIVIDTLLKNGVPESDIAALVRDENKASDLINKGIDIRPGDYDNKSLLNKAMIGVDKVLLISGLDMSKVAQQHKNVIDAAKEASIKCLAYTSNCLRDRHTLVNPIMKTHFETEDYIMASGLNYIIFRNVLYMESLALFLLGKDFTEKGIRLPAGDGKISYTLRSDEAAGMGNVLAGNDCSNRIYQFTNSKTYSFYDVADTLSELSGKTITYTPIDMDAYKMSLKSQGMNEHLIEMSAPFVTDIKNGQGNIVSNDLEIALGRKPTNLKEGLKQLLRF